MAVKSDVLAVTDEPTLISASGFGDRKAGQAVAVKNVGAVRVWLGGPQVVASNAVGADHGYPLDPDREVGVDLLSEYDKLYGRVVDATDGAVAILRVGA